MHRQIERETVEIKAVSMYPVHWATVDAFAKDAGYPSRSAALRRIIDEWLHIQKLQSQAHRVIEAAK